MGGTCTRLPAGVIHRQRPEGVTGKRPAYLDSSPEAPLPRLAWVRSTRPMATHLELRAPAAGRHDCVLSWPAPGPLASLPVLDLLLMFPGDTAPISFEKPCLQTLAPASTLSSQGIPAAPVSSSLLSVLQQTPTGKPQQRSRPWLRGAGPYHLCSQYISLAFG